MAQSTLEVGDREGFLEEARLQGKCAVTGKAGKPWHPHHVLYEQHLGAFGQPRFDRRNVLRVLENPHANHHTGSRKIRTVELLDINIDYVTYVMGAARGVNYLRRYYDDDTQPDPRLVAICQAM